MVINEMWPASVLLAIDAMNVQCSKIYSYWI